MKHQYIIKNIKLGIAVVLIVFQTSCSDFLEVKPMGKTIPSTPEEFDALLQNMLNDVDYGATALVPTNKELLSYECYADNLDMNIQAKAPDGSTLPNALLTNYVGTELSTNIAKYSNLYTIIRDCNIIIENMVDNGSKYSKKILGTSHVIRAIAYFQLVKDFCEPIDKINISDQLGVPLVYSFDMEERPIRSYLPETISRIEQDLQIAISCQVDDPLYRLTEDVARAYLARFYFWIEEWQKAIEESQYLLEKYPLLMGNEYKSMMTSNQSPKGNILFKSEIFRNQENALIEQTLMTNIKTKPLSKEFVETFIEKEKDIRYSLFMTDKRASIKKLFPCVRTDEMCLIIAESYAHLGNSEKALFYLNHIREKRIQDYVPYTLASLPAVDPDNLIKEDTEGNPLSPLTQAILNERRKELYLEADRWYELKRNGRPEFWRLSRLRTEKVITQKFMYTYPIPYVELVLVEGLIQNPGYTF